MGSDQSTEFVSTAENNYNPFEIPEIALNDPSKMNMAIGIQGCPPLHSYTKAKFAALPFEMMAAYADGVVRGSHDFDWFIKQMKETTIEELDSPEANSSSLGCLAYLWLKKGDKLSFELLNLWKERNKNSTDRL